jgi:hypothetical protein
MHGPYPSELRMRVIDFVEAGGTRRGAAEQFEVSVSSAIRWVNGFNEDGTCEPMPRGGSYFAIGEAFAADPRTHQRATGPSRWMRLFRRFTSGESQGAAVRCRFFARHGITIKKSLRAAERKRADVVRARLRWIREQGFLDPAHLVFIDETAVTTNMGRLNGWNPRGERHRRPIRASSIISLSASCTRLRRWSGTGPGWPIGRIQACEPLA